MRHRRRQSLVTFCTVCVALFIAGCSEPLGPLPGGRLSGEEVSDPVTDWSFAADVETAQLEVTPDDPHSINIWVGVADGRLFLPTSLILGAENPTEREWIQRVQSDARVRLRLDGRIYPASLARVADTELAAQVKAQILAKYDAEASAQSDGAWLFEVHSRPGG